MSSQDSISHPPVQIASPAGPLIPLAAHGLYWPAENALLVADLHLGKEATFQSHGIAVPTGVSLKTLRRVQQMLRVTGANQLLILGDLFHARSSLAAAVVQHFEEFLSAHANVNVTVIRGNHDIHWRDWPPHWNLEIVAPPLTINQIALAHYPAEPPAGAEMVICGHVHPAVRLQEAADLSGCHACFWYQQQQCLVLPAVGAFTGTASIKVGPQDRIWVPLGDHILQIPRSLLAARHHASAPHG